MVTVIKVQQILDRSLPFETSSTTASRVLESRGAIQPNYRAVGILTWHSHMYIVQCDVLVPIF